MATDATAARRALEDKQRVAAAVSEIDSHLRSLRGYGYDVSVVAVRDMLGGIRKVLAVPPAEPAPRKEKSNGD